MGVVATRRRAARVGDAILCGTGTGERGLIHSHVHGQGFQDKVGKYWFRVDVPFLVHDGDKSAGFDITDGVSGSSEIHPDPMHTRLLMKPFTRPQLEEVNLWSAGSELPHTYQIILQGIPGDRII